MSPLIAIVGNGPSNGTNYNEKVMPDLPILHSTANAAVAKLVKQDKLTSAVDESTSIKSSSCEESIDISGSTVANRGNY